MMTPHRLVQWVWPISHIGSVQSRGQHSLDLEVLDCDLLVHRARSSLAAIGWACLVFLLALTLSRGRLSCLYVRLALRIGN